MSNLDDLYREYGSLMIQQEIIQAKISELKQRIAIELNKPQETKDE